MNVTLIGMSGVGKSKVGRELAPRLGYSLVDIDRLIESADKKPLHVVLRDLGDYGFIARETEEVLGLVKIRNTVISTGGSIVYSAAAMDHLREISTVFFLDASLEDIKAKQARKGKNRGIVGLGEKNIDEIYAQRMPLYRRYADFVVDANGMDFERKIGEIIDNLKTLRRTD